MSENLARLVAAAERVSRVWRRGTDKTGDTMRDAINELDWAVAACDTDKANSDKSRMKNKPSK